ncbi:beta-1,3-galactosyltransferase brn-like isoform X1 [Leptidea sinapis]|uniref:beta-1,3-galactosyltransferase brn-like isoform X1 n=1 Tax=Leptidea sinapis TaxID=189913 RepID=UPI00213DFAEA|nr:beta-1,3-galactosyltransferase brn-like isoform X1 [Leptidea sinapis]
MRKRQVYQYCVCVCILLYIYHFFGVSDYLFSKSFDDDFDYPLNIDIQPVVNEILAGGKPSVTPINVYPYRYLTNSGKCKISQIDLFIVVKSAMDHFKQRSAVRETYGKENSVPGKVVKALFFLGIDSSKPDIQNKISEEMANYQDIIQMDFHDTYYNNTIKTMMSFRWLYEHCPTADFYLFTDDDMYISARNLLEYVKSDTKDKKDLFAGYVFESIPQRFRSSKWRVSLKEYPWNKWPKYVTAGAFVVSNKSLKDLYVASLFVQHFRFDDIYLGIVAKKMGVDVSHCAQFYFYKKKYTKDGYKRVIASHGYDDGKELIKVWKEQNL